MPGNPSPVAEDQRRASDWNRIARRSRWVPLFSYVAPKIAACEGSVWIAPSPARYVWAAFGAALGISLFAVNADVEWWLPHLPLWALRYLPKLFVHPEWHFGAVGLIVAALAVLNCARTNRIVFDGTSAPGRLQIVQGVHPFATRVGANVDELSVQLSVGDEKARYKGLVGLSVAHKGAEFLPIHLVFAAPTDSNLKDLYDCLAQRIKGEDLTTVRLSLPEGGEIVASRTPLGISSSSGRGTYRLAFSDADHGAFLPTMFQRCVPALVFLCAFFGNVFIAIIAYIARVDGKPFDALLLVPFAITLLIMLASQAVSVRRYNVACDREKLVIRRRSPWRYRSKCYPIDGFAAVQICLATGEGRLLYELNLVLRDPAGERLPIVCHGDAFALRTDAARLAQFLGVPLVDRSRSPAAG